MDLLIGHKLQSIRQTLSISQEKFAESIGISRANLSQIEQGKQNPTLDQLVNIERIYSIPYDYFFKDDKKLVGFVNNQLLKHGKITDKYPEISGLSILSESKDEYSTRIIPLIPIEAVAGLPNGDLQVMEYDVQSHYRVPEFNGKADFLIRINGTSMSPKYYNGDILACKRIKELTFIQWGKVYVMDTVQGPLVKRLYKCKDKEDCIICHSDNEKMYPRFEISKVDIRSTSIVIGTIRLE
jgi:repressor LexA